MFITIMIKKLLRMSLLTLMFISSDLMALGVGDFDVDDFVEKNKDKIDASGTGISSAVITNKLDASALKNILSSGLGAALIGELSKLIGSEADNKAVAANLGSQSDGKTSTVKTEDGSKELQVTTKNTRTEDRSVTVVRKKNISRPPKLDLIGEKYRAKVTSNVRQSPTTESKIVDGLQKEELFTAVGKVQGKNWYLVGKNNVAIGYVYGNLVELKTNEVVEQDVVLRDAVDLDNLGEKNDSGVVDLDELTVADEIEVNTSCKEMKVSDGDSSSESTVCKGSDGAWEIT